MPTSTHSACNAEPTQSIQCRPPIAIFAECFTASSLLHDIFLMQVVLFFKAGFFPLELLGMAGNG